MVAPCLIFFAVFAYVPMMGLIVAFKDYNFTRGIIDSPWTSNYGFKHFIDFFRYYDSGIIIRNTFVAGIIKILLGFPIPIILALILNEIRKEKFKRTVQTILYLPYFISWVIVSVMMFEILSPRDGVVNQIIVFFGGQGNIFFMMEGRYFFIILFISYIWKNAGWNSIIYLAAISGIDPQLYEAAEIDGAKKIRQIWYITLQSIKPTMGILFILSLGIIVSTGFEQNYLLRTPGNMHYADILDVFVLKQGFERGKYDYATAIGLMQGLTGFIMVVAANKLSRKFLEMGIW